MTIEPLTPNAVVEPARARLAQRLDGWERNGGERRNRGAHSYAATMRRTAVAAPLEAPVAALGETRVEPCLGQARANPGWLDRRPAE